VLFDTYLFEKILLNFWKCEDDNNIYFYVCEKVIKKYFQNNLILGIYITHIFLYFYSHVTG